MIGDPLSEFVLSDLRAVRALGSGKGIDELEGRG